MKVRDNIKDDITISRIVYDISKYLKAILYSFIIKNDNIINIILIMPIYRNTRVTYINNNSNIIIIIL